VYQFEDIVNLGTYYLLSHSEGKRKTFLFFVIVICLVNSFQEQRVMLENETLRRQANIIHFLYVLYNVVLPASYVTNSFIFLPISWYRLRSFVVCFHNQKQWSHFNINVLKERTLL